MAKSLKPSMVRPAPAQRRGTGWAVAAALTLAAVGGPATVARPQPDPAADAPEAMPAPPPQPADDPLQEPDEGKRAILQAVQAIRGLQSLSYRSRFYGTGPIEQIAPRGDGLVMMIRSTQNPRQWLQHVTGTGSSKAGDAEIAFDVAWSENNVEWVDHAQKKVMVRPMRQAKGPAYQIASSVRLAEMSDINPLAKEQQAESYTLEGAGDVDSVPCRIVLVTQAGGRGRTRWWLGESDHLPRKMARLFDGPSGAGEIVIELSEVMPGAVIAPETMQVVTPAGYTRDEINGAARATPATGLNAIRGHNGSAPGAPAEAVRPPAPPFELTSISGEKVSLASLAGNVVVLEFWGTWHLPSRAAAGEIQALAERFKGRSVRVYALSVREKSAEGPREFARSGPYTYGFLLDADKVADTYGVTRYPTFVIVGPSGEIVERITGFKKDVTVRKLEEAVEKAMGGMPGSAAGASRETRATG